MYQAITIRLPQNCCDPFTAAFPSIGGVVDRTHGVVVVVMLTHRDPPLVRRIADRVLRGYNTAVVIHHDPRGPDLHMQRQAGVLVMPRPRPAPWGRAALASATLDALEFAYAVVPEMSWLLVVSGQDYPCCAMTDIEDELAVSPYDAYERHSRIDRSPSAVEDPWLALTRTRYLHKRRIPGSHHHLPCPRVPPFGHGTDLYIGNMWTNLNAAAVEHVLTQRARSARVERYLARCQVPDEALLPTLLMNGRGGLRVANDRKRFIRWRPSESHPETLTAADAELIRTSGDFFARKVSAESPLLDDLDAMSTGPGALRQQLGVIRPRREPTAAKSLPGSHPAALQETGVPSRVTWSRITDVPPERPHRRTAPER